MRIRDGTGNIAPMGTLEREREWSFKFVRGQVSWEQTLEIQWWYLHERSTVRSNGENVIKEWGKEE